MAQINNITTNGASASSAWAGGAGNLAVYGEFAGGTVRGEYSFDDLNWIPVEAPNLGELGMTRNRGFNFELPECSLRVVVTNANAAELALTVNIASL